MTRTVKRLRVYKESPFTHLIGISLNSSIVPSSNEYLFLWKCYANRRFSDEYLPDGYMYL